MRWCVCCRSADQIWGTRIPQTSKARSIDTCESCGSSTKAGRTGCAFDPRRSAILLIGGDKTGKDRWYEENVPYADKLYDAHLDELRKEGLNNGKKVR